MAKTFLLLLPVLLLLSGCGPTAEQVMQYEHVLAAVGAAMGVGMWALGRRIGRRLGGRALRCPGCGRFGPSVEREGAAASCPACGKAVAVACLDAVTFARLTGGPVWGARLRLVKWAAMLSLVTFAVLSLPSLTADLRLLDSLGIRSRSWPEYENVLWFPIWFALFMPEPYVGLGVGLFFYSYHFLGIPSLFGVRNLEKWWWIAPGYFLTLLAPTVYWYLGLRRLRWGWLVPLLWGAANAAFATVVYLLHWNW